MCVFVGKNVKFRLILNHDSLRIYLFGGYHLLRNKIALTCLTGDFWFPGVLTVKYATSDETQAMILDDHNILCI